MLQRGEDGCQKHVALEGFSRLQDAGAHRFRQLGDVLLEADAAPEVLIEHDVETLAQVFADDRDVGLGVVEGVRP